jgi:hypothetical protein
VLVKPRWTKRCGQVEDSVNETGSSGYWLNSLIKHVKAHMRSLTSAWAGMTKARLFGTIAFVVAMFLMIGALGQLWIKSSEPYDLGRVAVAVELRIQPEVVELKRLAPFEFNEGGFSGKALFVLCAPESTCFTVVAKKQDGRWSVVDLVKR